MTQYSNILLLVCVCFLALKNSSAFQLLSTPTMMKNYRHSISMKNDHILTDIQKYLKKVSTAVVVSSLLLLNQPMAADAASSGGRSGGSSFRSSPRSAPRSSYTPRASSTRLNSSPSGRTTYIPMPMYSPFSYGFGGGFGGYSPLTFMSPTSFLIGASIYAIITIAKNRISAADFSDNNDGGMLGMLGDGLSVTKLQIGLSADWNDRSNIMSILSSIASKNSAITNRNEIASLLSEASLALLRKTDDVEAVSYDNSHFNNMNKKKGEASFQQLAITERAKFDEEKSGAMSLIKSDVSKSNGKTQAVVTLIVATKGKSSSSSVKSITSVNDIRQVLKSFASDSLVDEGESIMGVELLWTPVDRGDVLTERGIIGDFPELIKL